MAAHYTLYILGWLGYLFCAYAICALGWTVWKRRPFTFEKKLLACVEKWKRTNRLRHQNPRYHGPNRGTVRSFPLWALAGAFTVCGFMVYGVSLNQWPNETDHRVRILDHPTGFQWFLISDEHPDGYMYYACDDLPHYQEGGVNYNGNEAWIKAGYFAREARWQIRSGCNSIRASSYGFWYDWKRDGTAKTNKEEGYD